MAAHKHHLLILYRISSAWRRNMQGWLNIIISSGPLDQLYPVAHWISSIQWPIGSALSSGPLDQLYPVAHWISSIQWPIGSDLSSGPLDQLYPVAHWISSIQWPIGSDLSSGPLDQIYPVAHWISSIQWPIGSDLHCKKRGVSEHPRGAIFYCFHGNPYCYHGNSKILLPWGVQLHRVFYSVSSGSLNAPCIIIKYQGG